MKKVIDADDNELIKKLINLNIQYANQKSKLDIEYLILKIKKYRNLIDVLKVNKPLFFERKRLEQYNNKLEEYNLKINELYNEISKELDLIYSIKTINDE